MSASCRSRRHRRWERWSVRRATRCALVPAPSAGGWLAQLGGEPVLHLGRSAGGRAAGRWLASCCGFSAHLRPRPRSGPRPVRREAGGPRAAGRRPTIRARAHQWTLRRLPSAFRRHRCRAGGRFAASTGAARRDRGAGGGAAKWSADNTAIQAERAARPHESDRRQAGHRSTDRRHPEGCRPRRYPCVPRRALSHDPRRRFLP